MMRSKILPNNARGYILLVLLFMMLFMAVMAVGMNRRAGLQARMAANQTRSSQIHLGQLAALEDAAWTLSQNPAYRTSTSGEDYVFDGTTYNRTVLASSIVGYSDVVTVTVTAPGGLKQLTTSFRLIPQNTVFYLIADTDNHRIRRVDTATGLITTFAGDGSSGYSGDGGLAIGASLDKPRGVWADAAGIVYIADTDNNVIRKVDTAGIITTVAGIGGGGGFSGDGGDATNAELDKPHGVWLDSAGNTYIADTDNHVIRKVDGITGIITTVAGIGKQGGYTGDGGLATAAKLRKPRGLHVDSSGNIYIADTDNHVIRKVDGTTGIITTVAGTGSSGDSGDGGLATDARMDKPRGVFLDASGNIYIADSDNHRIKKVDGTTGIITTVAGTGSAGDSGDGGPAINARMDKPRGLWVDESGNIVIADTENNRIKMVDGATEIITTVAGDGGAGFSGDNGPATSASLKKPHSVCVYEYSAPAFLHIADAYNYEIRKVDMSTTMITKVAGTWWRGYNGDDIPATTAMLNYTYGVHVDASRNVYIADTDNHRIRKVDAKTGIITTVAGTGFKGYSGDGGPATAAKLRYPYNVYVDASGNIFIVDTMNYRIRKVDGTTGVITTVAGNGSAQYNGDGGPATAASIRKSYDVAVDGSGNIYIADTHNHAIRKVDGASGIITTVAGQATQAGSSGDGGPATSANLNQPYGVFVDLSKNIYIADSKNDRVRMVDATTGIITTVAGNGIAGDSGDGGPATLAQLDFPEGVWVDRSGNIYIADTFNDRVKMVDATTGIITTIAGTGSYGFNGNDIPATEALLNAPADVSLHEPSSLEKLPEVYRPSS